MSIRWVIFVTFLALDFVVWNTWSRFSDGFTLRVLDIGQGDAILLTTPEEHHILIDGGPDRTVLTRLGESLPYLFSQLDLVILTHPHADHLEGLIPVLDRFLVKAVLMSAPRYESPVYEAFLESVEALEVPVYFAEAGQHFYFGELELEVLYPFEPILSETMQEVNNASPVIMAYYEDVRILLTGDAEQAVEEALLEAHINLKADVLKAGHHGSNTSTTQAFLEAVSPGIALISVGSGNSYGHPDQEVIERLEEAGVEVFRTDLSGTLCLSFGPQSWLRSILAPNCLNFSSSLSYPRSM